MDRKTHYATVSEAINKLNELGFTIDFNLPENNFVSNTKKFADEEFEIVDVYRYEGQTDPADEATVYAIQSKTGIKGILVTGYGMAADETSSLILEKLNRK